MQYGEPHKHPLQIHQHVVPTPGSQQQPTTTKTLRFVTNSGAPHPKRRRIGAACLTCRRRKTACTGERPFCGTCTKNKFECAGYSSEPQPTSPRSTTPDRSTRTGPDHTEEANKKRNRLSPPQAAPTQNASPESTNADLRENAPRTASKIKPEALGTNANAVPASRSQQNDRKQCDQQTEEKAETSEQFSLFSGPIKRMPYFRWLGPTAIMPGFKQMVVKLKRQDTSERGHSSTNGDSRQSPSLYNVQTSDARGASSAAVDPDLRSPLNLPFYDTSPMPPSELITHLVNTFFVHLGCNYPFLQKERFTRDLEEKKVDAILVDAVCALAARFSTHQLLTQFASDSDAKASPAEYGHVFAQRAKIALMDTFPCPSVAAAQAALLLAYNEFGEQKDSGLWMYLGIAIRLAQDLGMHKLEGLKYIGRSGPTPKMFKRQSKRNSSSGPSLIGSQESAEAYPASKDDDSAIGDSEDVDEQKAVESERVDTFWAIFFLDRVVSSGTGRRSTLRDKDIELSFPSENQSSHESQWPASFPALIRIVHLYGRVADLLNSIKEPSDITPETPNRLADMERQVTDFYKSLSSRLHFDAVNFQHYMKAGEGTNFVLLHFWFHTLIILLHQPTLLKTFEGPMLQLFPNSQQLAMSSAKTIADILNYSQLMDNKASLGNPFTSQPIYIAACAFLKETAEQTAGSSTHSQATSPGREKETIQEGTPSTSTTPYRTRRQESITALAPLSATPPSAKRPPPGGIDPKSSITRHTLATVANRHYQLCYQALQSLELYWAGAKYILTVLDQKFQGVGDPLLYTTEEGEAALEEPKPIPAFTSPGWRRQHNWGPSITKGTLENIPSPFWKSKSLPESPRGPDSSQAIGWALTGTMDSSSTHLSYHYANANQSSSNIASRPDSTEHAGNQKTSGYGDNRHYLQVSQESSENSHRPSSNAGMGQVNPTNYSAQDANIAPMGRPNSINPNNTYTSPAILNNMPDQYHHHLPAASYGQSAGVDSSINTTYPNMYQQYNPTGGYMTDQMMPQMSFIPEDMMIESQDVDMGMLGLDMMPWFEPFPNHDMMNLFDPASHRPGMPGNNGSGHAE